MNWELYYEAEKIPITKFRKLELILPFDEFIKKQKNKQMEIYTRIELKADSFEILSADKSVLKNHNNKPFPHLSENISRNLISDLNAIATKYYKLPEREEEIEKVTFSNFLATITGEELRQSFGYCLLSSLIEYQNENIGFELEIANQIQWDRLFRLNSSSTLGILELNATKKARDFLDCGLVNFGLNYSQSIEEMKENGVQMVSEDIVNRINNLVDVMQFSHKIAVDILYNFFDYFSISIPILWVSGKINDEDFIAAYYVLQYGVDIHEIDEEAYEEPQFLMNRLLFLKTILW
jgi:hypothetical protein